LAYYGDDFTGSTDVLESLASGGIETVLFVEPPSEEMLRRYPNVRAIGIAGTGRTMTPEQMDATLPDIFCWLQQLRPKIVHYKICSTFDSSPEIGSIGRAIDIGQSVFENRFVPLVVGVPALQRFCLFGNLFARSGLASQPYRLDRHPTMRIHPITPMIEADLRVHLAQQTSRPLELIDVLTLERGLAAASEELDRVARQAGSVVLFDTLTDFHLDTIGRLIRDAQNREQKPMFVAGSSGVEYALNKQWRATTNVIAAMPDSVDRVVVVSGSCSPVTSRQIGWGLEHGFADVTLEPKQLLPSRQLDANIAEAVRQIVLFLDAGRSVIVHTGRGTRDTRISATDNLGQALGRILGDVVRRRPIRRLAMVGGDTSGQAARALGIEALQYAGPLESGAPLCTALSCDAAIDGVEIAFKGGQVGYDNFLGTLLCGQRTQSSVGAVV